MIQGVAKNPKVWKMIYSVSQKNVSPTKIEICFKVKFFKGILLEGLGDKKYSSVIWKNF
jgi:hypothetical protein